MAELEDLFRQALAGTQPPPAEFVAGVMTGAISIPPDVMSEMVDRGWLPRQKCEVWSRVMGYYRPVGSWNVGKKAEHAERRVMSPEELLRINLPKDGQAK